MYTKNLRIRLGANEDLYLLSENSMKPIVEKIKTNCLIFQLKAMNRELINKAYYVKKRDSTECSTVYQQQ